MKNGKEKVMKTNILTNNNYIAFNKYVTQRQSDLRIYVGRLAAILLLCLTVGVGQMTGADYEMLTPGTHTLSNGDEILIAIEDRKAGTFTFIQSGSTKHLVQTVTDGVVSNPAAATIWIATASSSNWIFRMKNANSNGYLSNGGGNTTLSTNSGTQTTWAVSNNALSGYKYFRIQRSASTVRYVGWSGSTFAAYATSNFAVQGASSNIAQYSGALQIFRKVAGYAITWNNGGHGTAPTSPTSATSLTLSAITATGYTCTGWTANVSVTNTSTSATISAGTLIPNGTSVTLSQATTFTAQWSAKTTTISFNQNGGTGGQTTSKTATYGSAMPTPITCPTREHYDFAGYYDGAGGTGTQYYTNTGASARTWNKDAASATLYAKWTEHDLTNYRTSCTACEAPDHVNISGAWDRFGGETISLTATPYDDSDNEITTGITGYQWQKLITSTWTNLTNGTADGVTISGATSANLQIANCGLGNSGKYRCIVSTGADCSTASATATDGSEGFGVKVYVLECYTGGTTVYNFTRDENNQRGSVEVTLSASTNYTFKIHADQEYYGNNGTVNKDETNWVCSTSENNLTVASGLGGTFTFTMDYSSGGNNSTVGIPELSITYPRKTIYLIPNSDWLSNSAKFAYYYFRSNDEYGWTDFIAADACGMSADIPQWNGIKVIAVRFNSTKGSTGNWDDKWNQTDDITVTGDKNLITITGWNNSQTYTAYAVPTYTITFAGNGNTGGSMSNVSSITCGDDRTLAANGFTKTGYTFANWKTNVAITVGGSPVAANGAVANQATINNITSNITLTAQWNVNSYNLTWNLNGGTTTSAGTGIASGVSVNTTTSVAYGTSLTAPTVTKEGYTFSSWSPSVASTMPAGATTYTAQWSAKTYDVTLDRNGATTGSTSVTMTYNSSSHTAITAPTKDGHVFGGWYTGSGGTGTLVMDASGVLQANVAGYTGAGGIWTRTTTPTTLYAKWEAAKVFTLATSGTTLVDGDEIVIMSKNSTYAMSTTQESNYRGATTTDFEVDGSTLTVYATSNAQVIFLEEEGSYLLFNVGGYNYLYSTSASSGSLKTQDISSADQEITGNSKWSYSIDASNNADIYTNGDNSTYKYLQYNSGSPRFKCYSSGNQEKVKIYCHHITTPFVRYSPEALQTFQYAVGYGPSLAQALHIKGYNLTGNLTVTCPSGYELSETSNANDFAASNLTLTRSSGKVNTTIYIRLAAGKSVGSYNANLAISGGGITTTNVPLVGQVTAVAASGEMYRAVLDATDIFPYDTLVLLNDTGTWIMSKEQNTNNRTAINTGFIYKGTTVYVTDGYANVQKIITEECSTDDRWLLKAWNTTNYLYAASASGNQLKSAAQGTVTTDHKGEWRIVTNATGIATIDAPESSMRDTINFNYNAPTAGNKRLFNCYKRFLNGKNAGTILYYRISPNIWCKPSSLTGFSVDYGAGASAAQTFTVQGKNLGENIVTLTAPTGYEISKTSSSTGYATELTLTPTNGKITSTTIWVRITAGNEAGTYNGEITATATGAATRTVTLEGVVNPVPEITLTASSDPLYVTSRNGISIMAVGHLTLSISGARAGQAVTISGTDLVFYKDNGTKYVNLSTTPLTAPLTNQVVYVFYSPSSDGTGAITSPDITVSCDGGSETFSGKIKVRNLPDKVAIVAKTGDTWMALPGSIPSATNPSSVLVSVADGKAYGTNAVAYKLWPVKTTNGTADRSGTATGYDPAAKVADRLRFTGYAGGNKGLWANNVSGTGTGYTRIRTVVVIDEISDDGSSGETPEEWKVVTTEVDGQFAYTLQTQQTNNTKYLRFYGGASGGPKWGTYADGTGINTLYILPLEEITEADITVMEWGTNKIAVSYPNRASCTALTAKIGSSSPTSVTINSIGGDIYELTGVGDLQGNPAKTLVLSATEGSAKQKIVSIPYIITTDGVAEATIRSAIGTDVAKLTDVVIRNGGKLTTGTTSGNFKDLYIYPGGKAAVTKKLTVKHVYMRGGYSWLGGDYALPQLNVASGVSLSGINATNCGIFYDLCLDNSIYYMMALPKTVALSAVTNEIGTTAFDAWIKEYSGEGRTLTPKSSGWSYVSGANIERGKGYEIAIKPRISGRPYGILRFPLLKSTTWSDEETPFEPSVTGWGCNDANVTDNNKGWNCLGNPFLTAYNNTATPGTTPSGLIQTKTLVHHPGDPWNGTWDWSESTVKYFTIPRYTEYEYDDVRAYPYKLDAFHPFFIQVTGDGTLSFAASNKALKAPSRYAQKMEREVFVDFALKDNDGKKDEAGLTISNQYSEAFDMNDKEKTIQNGNATMKVYTMVGDYRVAYNALPEAAAAQLIPVGYIAPEAGSYKFSRVDGADYSEVEHLWLTDYETSDVVDLLVEDFYAFESAAGQINNRFAINAVLKPEQDNTATGLEDQDSDAAQPMKFIYQDKLYILRGGVIYDATGRRVMEINK